MSRIVLYPRYEFFILYIGNWYYMINMKIIYSLILLDMEGYDLNSHINAIKYLK